MCALLAAPTVLRWEQGRPAGPALAAAPLPRWYRNIAVTLQLIPELMPGEKKLKLHLKGIHLFIF